MKHGLLVLFGTMFLSGLASASHITLSCVTLGPANVNFWTAMECTTQTGATRLITLALQQDDQTLNAPDSGDPIPDTRTDFVQAAIPVTTIGAAPVSLPQIAVFVSTAGPSRSSAATAVRNEANDDQASGPSSSGSSPATSAAAALALTMPAEAASDPVRAMFAPGAAPGGSTSPLGDGEAVFVSKDPIGLATAPEPSAWVLVALGLTVILYRIRRRSV